MSAKHKLNKMHVYVALIIACIVGIATGSMIVFFIALAVLLVAAFHSGDIRR